MVWSGEVDSPQIFENVSVKVVKAWTTRQRVVVGVIEGSVVKARSLSDDRNQHLRCQTRKGENGRLDDNLRQCRDSLRPGTGSSENLIITEVGEDSDETNASERFSLCSPF